MRKYIETSPTETMLIELALGEFNMIVAKAEEQKQRRLAVIRTAHPESKSYDLETRDGKLCLVYDEPEASVPPVDKKKPRKLNVL